ncbi:hypothetical protein [Brevundimonas sp.]|uniref:hypothetical protein n=1 Tax=Brevundimonas sp. TaxID=1871086 RepID=UPI002ABA3DB5|nr:hypothetical protein [Brevundimonas sp.]MDZ4363093.1 hypothetical protein [Brevundimonas sp.]
MSRLRLLARRVHALLARPAATEWRILVLRHRDTRPDLYVLAPVRGDEFDWDTLRHHVAGRPWPRYTRAIDAETAVLDWIGHHTFITTIDGISDRLSMDRLVPGKLGTGTGYVLTEVRAVAVDRVLFHGFRRSSAKT